MKPLKQANDWLRGRPESILRILLLGLSAFGIAIALFGSPLAVAAVTTYYAVP